LASPGGWQLIGRTPLKMFSIDGEHTNFVLSAGDRVRFVPITEEDYRKMEAAYD
jgi:inhibitor of KinA